MSEGFISTSAAAGSPRTTCGFDMKGGSAVTPLHILVVLAAAPARAFPPGLSKPFNLAVIFSPACPVSLSEAALTAGVVEHHDVVHGDVAPPLPGDGRLDQHLQR